jgi:site-specific recombinase XerD
MDTKTITWETAISQYLATLTGKNRSAGTIRGYTTNLLQFRDYVPVASPLGVSRAHINDFLTYCGSECGHSGVYRARVLSVIREFFRFLAAEGYLERSPAENIGNPAKERKTRQSLRPDEYNKLLALAGSNSRDYGLFQVLLQTGIRVSELCNLEIDDIDLVHRVLTVRSGKGKADREIELEKKAIKAIQKYLKDRPQSATSILFLNRYGEPLSERGVRKLIVRYSRDAGLDKKISPHVFRHTFGTIKAESGKVSPFQLQQWLGHRNINTTQIYVHLGKEHSRRAMDATSL